MGVHGNAGARVLGSDVHYDVVPESPCGGVFATDMPVGELVYPLVRSLGIVPSQTEYELEIIRVGAEAFQSGTYSLEIASTVAEGLIEIRYQCGEVAVQQGVPSEVQKGAGYVIVSVEPVGKFPSEHPVVMIVEHYHLAPGYASEVGFHVLRGPVLTVVDEEPSHLKPYGVGICGFQRLPEGLAHRCQRFRIP